MIHVDTIKIGLSTKAFEGNLLVEGQRKFFIEVKKLWVNAKYDEDAVFLMYCYTRLA